MKRSSLWLVAIPLLLCARARATSDANPFRDNTDEIEIESNELQDSSQTIALANKRLPASAADKKDVPGAGKDISSTADLYKIMPVEAKESKVVGGLVKSYSGMIDLMCAK